MDVDKIKKAYRSYTYKMDEIKELSKHNKDMKNDFVKINFGHKEKEEQKSLKKEIDTFFKCIKDVAKGKEPVEEIKSIRREHLDFSDEQYNKLMTIFNQVMDNEDKSKEIKEDIKGLCESLLSDIEEDASIISGMFKFFYDTDKGKYPKTQRIVDLVKQVESIL